MKKFLKWGGIAIIIIIVIAAFSSGDKSSTSNSSQSSGTAQEKQQTPTEITAQQLADDFDGNQVAAEAKWKDKLVQFSATISNITDTGLSFSSVASKQFSTAQISCRVNDKQQLLSLNNGETVTVKGIIGSQTIGVIDMSDCEVVK